MRRIQNKKVSQKIGNSPYASVIYDLGIVFARGYDKISKLSTLLIFPHLFPRGAIKYLFPPKLDIAHIILV